MDVLKYLAGYPPHVQARVRELIEQGRLGDLLANKYGQAHTVRSDSQLREYVQAIKDRHLSQSADRSQFNHQRGARHRLSRRHRDCG